MKRSTFRKSSLISSVALLLVAIVALSGATFAWFSSNTTATASNLKASTTQSSNLVLSETGEKDTWVNALDYKMTGANLQPTTTNNFTQWFTNTAKSYNSTEAAGANQPIAEGSDANYYVAKDLYIKNDGAEAVTVDWALTVTPTDTGDDAAFRVALQPVGEADGAFVYGTAKDDTATTNEDQPASMVTTTSKTGELATIDAGEELHYVVYLYYEGTDPQCIDSLAKNTCAVGFTFSKSAD